MNLQFLEPKSAEEWDRHVLQLENYSFVLSDAKYRSWQDSSIKSFRYLIFDNEQFVGIVGGIIDNVKIFGNYLECKHNPMLIPNIDDERKAEILRGVFKKLQEIGHSNNCFLIRLSPLVEYDEIFDKVYLEFGAKESPVHPQDALISQYFDISKSEEDLRHEMSSSTRNNINKLLKNEDVTVKVVKDSSAFDIFKDFYKQTKELKGYRGKSADYLLKEFEYQIHRDMLYFVIGYFKGKPISVWQNSRFGKYMHVYQAGSDVEFREKNVRMTYLLFWESIKLCKELGVEILDLFGGMLPEGYEGKGNPWKGVNDFKMGFGGEKVTYMHPRDIPLKRYYSIYLPYARFRVERRGHTVDW
jgi:lipid II:glycine glycyltransferase (peptidoglycan interpeptide bridge formation enzyme)